MSRNSGIDTVDNVYTFAEATQIWKLSESTLKNRCNRGHFALVELKEGRDYRKSAGTWLITDMAMRRLYGPQPIELLISKVEGFAEAAAVKTDNLQELQDLQKLLKDFTLTEIYKEIKEGYMDQHEDIMKHLVSYYIQEVNKRTDLKK